MKKGIVIISILILLLILRHVGLSITHLIETEGTVRSLRSQLGNEKKEHVFLKQRLSYVRSDEFVEKEAREKLGLVRDAEHPVFLTPPSMQQPEADATEVPNWQKWAKLFRI
jgi:cell division protein FtsB